MRRLAVGASSLLLTACIPGQVQPAERPGPTLVVEMTNATDRDVVVGHEYESPGQSGSGESFASACRRETLLLSEIRGDYQVTVDGEPAFEGSVPDGADSETYVLIRVTIGPDAEVGAAEPIVVTEVPDVSADVPGCGA